MYINSEAIVFKQVKATSGRKMIVLFTKKYGKISAGSNIGTQGKKKTSLATNPFCYGNYEFFKNKDFYNLNSGEVIKSFYKIGEDVDKYMLGSFVLEITDKVLYDEAPEPKLFNLLIDFLTALEVRERKHETLVLAYEVKMLELVGAMPSINKCACCGKSQVGTHFSIRDGGMICNECIDKQDERLIYNVKFDIINILNYFLKTHIRAFDKIALDEAVAKELQGIMRKYMSYHLGIDTLKSDSIFTEKY